MMTTTVSVKIQSNTNILKKLINNFKLTKDRNVDVGFLGGKHHEEIPEFTVAEIATIHEFGTDDGRIPSRPFIRQTLSRHKNYNELLRKETKRNIERRLPLSNMLFRIGETVRSDMIEEIELGEFVPLSPVTIKNKKSTKILIDTGFMQNSIEWRTGK